MWFYEVGITCDEFVTEVEIDEVGDIWGFDETSTSNPFIFADEVGEDVSNNILIFCAVFLHFFSLRGVFCSTSGDKNCVYLYVYHRISFFCYAQFFNALLSFFIAPYFAFLSLLSSVSTARSQS